MLKEIVLEQISVSRCLVIDDHPIFGDAMAMALVEIFDHPHVETSESLFDGIENIKRNGAPDFIVLDLNLPDVDGLDGLLRLVAVAPDANIVVVSSITDNAVIATALEYGAAGFVPKNSARLELINAFRRIAVGERYTPENYFEPRREKLDPNLEDVTRRIASLTPQQATILRYIAGGKLNKQIAYELSIAETTVKAHLTAIMRKLGVQNRTQAALFAKRTSFDTLVDPK